MNTASLLVAAVLAPTFASGTVLAEQSTIDTIYGALPSITPYEKSCVLTFSTPAELRTCIKKIPNTEFYRNERQRSLGRLDQLSAIAGELRTGGSTGPLDDPWFKFCLSTSTPACLDACIKGWVCSSN